MDRRRFLPPRRRERRHLRVAAQTSAAPVVDRLVVTNVVDIDHDIFAKAGRLSTLTLQRTPPGRSETRDAALSDASDHPHDHVAFGH